MNKEAYLNELARYLKLLPPEECAELMGEFKEHFEFARLSGRSEAEIISKLGHPRLIARELLTQSQIEKADKSPTLLNVTRAVKATVSLGLFNLVIVLLPFVASLAVLAGGGLLIVIGALKFTRVYYNLVIRYLKYNLTVIRKDVTSFEE
ncbi:HAAS signaling domain-containing protein [Paenibacillus rhizoplanae]|uniref:HAAS domain-containing protein n=1 Tax=Paenibacillus rhizoplanae TaxID=1917181 RepID=A0ABW5FAV1_9BACL